MGPQKKVSQPHRCNKWTEFTYCKCLVFWGNLGCSDNVRGLFSTPNISSFCKSCARCLTCVHKPRLYQTLSYTNREFGYLYRLLQISITIFPRPSVHIIEHTCHIWQVKYVIQRSMWFLWEFWIWKEMSPFNKFHWKLLKRLAWKPFSTLISTGEIIYTAYILDGGDNLSWYLYFYKNLCEVTNFSLNQV